MKTKNLETDFLLLEERECAQRAVEKMRMDTLCSGIDDLVHRMTDCKRLIGEGKYDYQRAFEVMIKPQVERIVEAKSRVLDTASLPSVILSNSARRS